MPTYFRFGIGPFRYSQRLGRTAAQKRKARADRQDLVDAWMEASAGRKTTWEIHCQVTKIENGTATLAVLDTGTLRRAAVGGMTTRQWYEFVTSNVGLEVEKSKPFTVGQYVNVLARRGKIRDIVPETAQQEAERLEQEAFWAAMEEEHRQALETAKQTGYLLLDDGEVDAYHGVTADGTQCHHRHRTWQAAAECAQRGLSPRRS